MNDLPLSDEFLEHWDKLNAAIDAVLCAIPQQMTNASLYLELQRKVTRDMFNQELLRYARNK